MRGASGDDAPVLAGVLGVGRDHTRRCEVAIALERKAAWPAGGASFVQVHVAEFIAIAETLEADATAIPSGTALATSALRDSLNFERNQGWNDLPG